MNTTLLICLIILAVAIIVALIAYYSIKKNNKYEIAKPKALSDNNVKLVKAYCSPAEMHFMEALFQALPKDFIAFPYVPLEKLLLPNGDRVDFNIAQCKVVDICIFLQKTMEPVLVIDLFAPSPVNQSLKKIDEEVIKLLKKVKLPIIQIKLQEDYNLDTLRADLLNSMNEKVFIQIKDMKKNN